MKYNIPLSDEYKALIAKAVSDAHKDDISEFKMEFDLATYNCTHYMRSDFISTNLRNSFSRNLKDSSIKLVNFKASWFEPVMIYDRHTNYLYSFTSKENFLKQKSKNNRSHYIYALASINKNLEPKHVMEQICLFEEEIESCDEKISKILMDIQKKVDGPLKQYVLVTYTSETFGLTSITAYIPTVNLDIAYEEDWSEYIIPTFEITPMTAIDSVNEEDIKEIKIKIREEFLVNKDKDNNIMKLNENEKINDETDIVKLRNDRKENKN